LIKNPYIEIKSRLKTRFFSFEKIINICIKKIFNLIIITMKKFKWFTLLESLTVIAIIGIISTALFNMRNVWKDYSDKWKEAVNVIHKEITRYLKDFQRNKTWTDSMWIEHEASSFQIIFNSGSSIIVGNIYIYEDENGFLRTFYDSGTLIDNQRYSVLQNIKWIDKYLFKITDNYWYTWLANFKISKDWIVSTGLFEDSINAYNGMNEDDINDLWCNDIPNQHLEQVCATDIFGNILGFIAGLFWGNWNSLNNGNCLAYKNKKVQCNIQGSTTTQEAKGDTENVNTFFICWKDWDEERYAIWKIHLNQVTETAKLIRCEDNNCQSDTQQTNICIN